MTNGIFTANDIKDLVLGSSGDFTGGLLSSLLLASKIARRFQSDIGILHGVILKLGGIEALRGTLRAVQDVARWWP